MNKVLGCVAASLLMGPLAAQADYLLDTGAPTTIFNAGLQDISTFFGGRSQQHLGVSFNVGQDASITSVEGYIGTGTGGSLRFELHEGASPNGALLYSSLVSVAAFTMDWVGATGLDWYVAAGDYTLTVIAQPGFQGNMRYTPASPAGAEWYKANSGVWTDIGNFDMAWRVGWDSGAAAVPVPATLWLAGLGLAGLALNRRRPRAAAPA